MKVVQINAVNKFSSTGTNTYELHEYLRREGHESYVFCTNEDTPSENVFRIGNSFDYKLHALLSRITGLQAYYSKYPSKKLIRHLCRLNPDVVLLGNLHGNYINIGYLLKYLGNKNITTVNVLHDCWSFTGHCCHYTKIHCRKWQNECHSCPLLREDNTSYIDRSTKIFRDKKRWFKGVKRLGVIGVSKWIRREAEKSPIFPVNTEFTDIYNWIDLETFRPGDRHACRKELNLSEESFYAISVSHEWSLEKGLDILISLAKKIPTIQILLIGRKPENIEDIPKNLIFTGVISDKHILRSYYVASDVYLNLSSQETFGKVSAEALSCGLPVIAGNNTACPEVVGPCGKIVDLNDFNQITEILNQFISKRIEISREACRKHAIENFDKDKNLSKYLKFFECLLHKKN